MIQKYMIELFERTLLNGGDLEQARQTLLNQANSDRINRIHEIEHDFRISFLVRECLITEPKGSSGYGCAKGIMNRLRMQYRDKESEKTLRKLKRLVKEKTEVKIGDDGNREKTGNASDPAGTEETAVT